MPRVAKSRALLCRSDVPQIRELSYQGSSTAVASAVPKDRSCSGVRARLRTSGSRLRRPRAASRAKGVRALAPSPRITDCRSGSRTRKAEPCQRTRRLDDCPHLRVPAIPEDESPSIAAPASASSQPLKPFGWITPREPLQRHLLSTGRAPSLVDHSMSHRVAPYRLRRPYRTPNAPQAVKSH